MSVTEEPGKPRNWQERIQILQDRIYDRLFHNYIWAVGIPLRLPEHAAKPDAGVWPPTSSSTFTPRAFIAPT